MKNRYLWPSIAFCSLFVTVTLIVGFGFVIKDMLMPAATKGQINEIRKEVVENTALKQASEIKIVAIGDSLTKGTGDSSGKGYVQRLADGLKVQFKKPVKLVNNLAVNGMQTTELRERLLTDPGYHYAIKRANLIVFSIGGNDLFLSARTKLANRKLSAMNLDELTVDFEAAIDRFNDIAKQLNKLNPSATIVYMGLYNPFYDIPELRDASLKMQKWNKDVYETIFQYPNMLMVPTFDLFEGRIMDYLSSDHFHPNDFGYERIASRMLESVN
ncbi:GDSL-type esterase/lipase family protein [Paenibacillus sp. L3-i20]|uniref:GDSL-type esterase/lipase family protein n=1 Tax=Paenibacillus sp. L3-i20 TaxID=2905833 RepID=UPI001EDD15CA|nr:GDSL-type esterase/lipase family protein [Paenibacillus sp. L3-i20]GKU79471.1 lipase/acylhydrolase [Paenibacillus sp. L3-i20]